MKRNEAAGLMVFAVAVFAVIGALWTVWQLGALLGGLL